MATLFKLVHDELHILIPRNRPPVPWLLPAPSSARMRGSDKRIVDGLRRPVTCRAVALSRDRVCMRLNRFDDPAGIDGANAMQLTIEIASWSELIKMSFLKRDHIPCRTVVHPSCASCPRTYGADRLGRASTAPSGVP